LTRLARLGFQLRYSPGIEFIRDPDILIEKTIPKSDWFLTAIHGMNVLGGDFSYTKLEFKGRYKYHLTAGSLTRIILRSGYITDNAPLTQLFNGYGSYAGAFSFVAPFSFNTMHQNEFAASQYAAIHLRHEFGSNFYSPSQKFKPIFVLSQNMGIGYLNSASSAKYQMTDFRRGYLESGFEINNLLKIEFLSWGKEGETYKVENSERKYLSANYLKDYGLTAAGWGIVFDEAALTSGFGAQGKIATKDAPKYEARCNPVSFMQLTEAENEIAATTGADIKKLKDENIARFILGDRSFSEWDAYVQDVEKLGVAKVLEMYTKAYERYK
jgi:hypothetical protein